MIAQQRRLIDGKLQAAFEAELAARQTGGTARPGGLDRGVAEDCVAIMESNSDPARLVALTLCGAKAAAPAMDVQQIQGGDLDFRSVAVDIVVPLVTRIAEQQNVAYRPSPNPFVSNPFREPRIDAAWVAQRRPPAAAAAQPLLNLLTFVQANAGRSDEVLAEIVAAQVDRFERERVEYQVPSRVTVAMVVGSLEEFLTVGDGGSRLERVTVALLRFAGEKAGHWDEVIGHHGNDAARRDADCLRAGVIVALGESKDQVVTVAQVRQLAEEMTTTGAGRGLLISREAHLEPNRAAIAGLIERRHLLGQRIEVLDVLTTARGWLVLMDGADADLPRFLEIVCDELDQQANLPARRDWAEILASLG